MGMAERAPQVPPRLALNAGNEVAMQGREAQRKRAAKGGQCPRGTHLKMDADPSWSGVPPSASLAQDAASLVVLWQLRPTQHLPA